MSLSNLRMAAAARRRAVESQAMFSPAQRVEWSCHTRRWACEHAAMNYPVDLEDTVLISKVIDDGLDNMPSLKKMDASFERLSERFSAEKGHIRT